MSIKSPRPNDPDAVGLAAAEWVLRHDRGLTAAEQDNFSQWLAAEPRHRAAWAEHRWGWDELDRLAGLQTSMHAVPDPDLLAPRKLGGWGFSLTPALSFSLLAAAAAVAFVVFLWQRPTSPGPASLPLAAAGSSLALIEQRELPDGSVVELNRGAVVTEHFTAGERRVRLARGEAHFKVVKDAARPFFVEAAGIAVRAVGTAFNVRLDSSAVEVLVTEGQVGVERVDPNALELLAAGSDHRSGASAGSSAAPSSAPHSPSAGMLLAAGERTLVSLAPAAPAPAVTTLSPAEMEARLAWQPRLLDFTNAPLPEIVAAFNRRNPVHLSLGDPRLAELRLSATFRSDNVEGFVRLMTSDFNMRAERRGAGEIVLLQVR